MTEHEQAYETLSFAVEDDAIGVIEFDRPGKANSVTPETILELDELLTRLEHDPDLDHVRVVVFTGAGDAFCTGGDITSEGEMLSKEESTGLDLPDEYRRFAEWALNEHYHERGQEVFYRLETLPHPTIAAVNGWAVGVGMELVAACDLAVASERATFSEVAASVGFLAEWGGAWNLPKVVGVRTAFELMYTGRPVEAEEALRIDLVNDVVAHDELMDRTLELAGEIASRPAPAIRMTKELIRTYLNEGHREAAREDELEKVIALNRMGVSQEGIRAFEEGRSPIQTDERGDGQP